MKALVYTKPYKFELQERDIPVIKDNEVLIEIKAVGICGSDVHGMTGKTGRRIPPVVMGHEASGIIVSKGRGVKGYNVGDRVTFDSTIYCNQCEYCLNGRINLCENRRVLGVSCDEYRKDGAMADFLAVPKHILYRLPEGVTFYQAALAEPVSVAFHGVKRANINQNDTVAVIGCGIIGLLIIQCAKIVGCGRIFAVDINKDRLQMAKKMGADYTINSRNKDAVREIEKMTNKKGAQVCFEAVGLNDTVNTAVSATCKGGTLVLIGNWSQEVTLPLQKIVTREINIKGSYISAGEYKICIDMMSIGRLNVDSLISRVVPLEEGPKWFQTMLEAKEPLFKVILEPSVSK
jgi:L-iditol 2-dehydrogenase